MLRQQPWIEADIGENLWQHPFVIDTPKLGEAHVA
jgi:hypothetical protein